MKADGDTKARLVAAASALFAAHGFHGTTVREIAARAGVNLAAGNYHFGSKKALYLEVFRAQFAEIRALLARRGATRSPAELAALSRAELRQLFERRVRAMLELLIGPPTSVHGALMQREMMDPSEALPVIVEEMIRPLMREMEEMLARLRPDLPAPAVERAVFSVVGQVLFYHHSMPAVLGVLGVPAYPAGFADELSAHISAFSLGGIAGLAPTPAGEAKAAGAPRARRRRTP